MKLSTLNKKFNLISVGTNSKTSKGDSEKELTAIMYLAHADISGYNVCPKASEGCKTSCLFTAGRGAMNSVMQARIRKTKLFFENQKEFLNLLTNDLNLFNQYCIDNDFTGYVRLNGTSDITWESYDIIQKYPNLKFYDYTKIYNRDISNLKNYRLTYSRSEDTTDLELNSALNNNISVAVVFDEIPVTWKNKKVINGDLNDLRYNEANLGLVIGLKEKGKAKKDTSGFVVRLKT